MSEKALTESFNLETEFEGEVRSRVEELIALCEKLGMPVSVSVVTSSSLLDGANENGKVHFNVMNIVAGSIMRMPIEFMVGVGMLSSEINRATDEAARRNMAFILSGSGESTEFTRADYRAACANSIVRDAIARADARMDEEAEMARWLLSLYSNPDALSRVEWGV